MMDSLSAETRRRRRQPGGEPRLLLTIAWHPDWRRVGASAWLDLQPGGEAAAVNRAEPLFVHGDDAAPLQDPFISRAPLHIQRVADAGWTISGDTDRIGLVVMGRERADSHQLDASALRAGVVIVLQDRVALLLSLHGGRDGHPATSRPLATLRERLTAAASLDVPMVVVGPPGVAKSEIARLAHDASERSAGPFVVATAASWQGDSDGAVLRGRANDGSAGLIHAAQGGSLLVEAIEEAPDAAQVALIELIDHGTWSPVGGGAVRRADVRVVATCHHDLDEAVRRKRLRADLLRRLRGFEVAVAPLCERRVDLPRMLLNALHGEYGALERTLPLPDGEDDPWLPARVAAALVAGRWPGNERSFRNVVRGIVLRDVDNAHATLNLDAAGRVGLEALALRQLLGEQPRASELTVEAVKRAMRASGFRASAAARLLGVSRSHLYGFMRARPDAFRLAPDLGIEDVKGALAAMDGDVAQAARALEISARSLVLRITQLGLDA